MKDDEASRPGAPWRSAFLGAVFFVLFMPFINTLSLQTTVNASLGYLGMALMYSLFGLGNLLAPAIVRKCGLKLSLFAASLTYVLYLLANVYVLSYTYVAASALNGFASAVLWASQGGLLTLYAEHEKIGFHSGLFWGIFRFSGITGSLLCALFFRYDLSIQLVFGVNTAICCVAAAATLLLPKPPSQKEYTAEPYLKTLSATVRFFKDYDMLLLVFFAILHGVSRATTYGPFTQLVFGPAIALPPPRILSA
eukprot:TRINITY_DN1713_c0_g1_i3.p1 TRINITY_DN1713_c0_g1~~TRINITY_DN1713_c0_g1_i3.p1  ORF type:complete len:278 (-),score=28.94 TRINITY_DN1713_c0_g1_i3:581-1336(-)